MAPEIAQLAPLVKLLSINIDRESITRSELNAKHVDIDCWKGTVANESGDGHRSPTAAPNTCAEFKASSAA